MNINLSGLISDWTDIEAVHYCIAVSLGLIQADSNLSNESVSWKVLLNTRNPIMEFVIGVYKWMLKQGYFEEDEDRGLRFGGAVAIRFYRSVIYSAVLRAQFLIPGTHESLGNMCR